MPQLTWIQVDKFEIGISPVLLFQCRQATSIAILVALPRQFLRLFQRDMGNIRSVAPPIAECIFIGKKFT